MPDPREAVYDVLLSKKRRAEEEREIAQARNKNAETLKDLYDEWNDNNRRARSAAK